MRITPDSAWRTGLSTDIKMKVYLDNSATTKVDEVVAKEMKKCFSSDYGNPSSIHELGRNASKLVENSREAIAKEINCSSDEIIFTSGGTEANNLALNILNLGEHLITTKIEHPSVMNKAKELEKQSVSVTFVGVDKDGFVDFDELERSITPKTKLVSVIHANNEIGTVQDIEKIGNLCRNRNILFHTDCVQSFKKEKIDVKKMKIDLLSVSAHKIHGPKGAGVLYVRRGIKLKPLLFGGSQEMKKRAGTENVPGIAGMAKAVSLPVDSEKIRKLRDYMIKKIENEISDVKLNGSREKRLCSNINFSFKHVEGESLLMSLDLEGIAVSTGSACSSRSLEPSYVLMALGLDHATAHGSIRFSLSKYTTKKEIDYCVEKLKKAVKKLREVSALK